MAADSILLLSATEELKTLILNGCSSVRRWHGLKHLLVGGLGTSPLPQASQGPRVVLCQLGGDQLHAARRATPGPAPCRGRCAGPQVGPSVEMPDRGGEGGRRRWGGRGTFPPTDNHLLTRLCTQEMATAPRGCFFLICPPRGSTFFCFPQRCHIGQQCASGQGCLKDEGMSPSGALTGLTVLTPMPCAHDHRSLGTLPFRLY